MKTATLKQGKKVLELIEETPAEHLQMLIGGGYISDLLKANVAEMNRGEFRKLCGLSVVPPAIHNKWRRQWLRAADAAARAPSGLSGGI